MCQVPQTLEATLVTTLATLGVVSAVPGIIPQQMDEKRLRDPLGRMRDLTRERVGRVMRC